MLVARIEPLSPAARAGLQPGDVITAVKGRTVSDADDVVAATADVPKDQTVTIELVRDGKALAVSAKLTTDVTSWLGPPWSMGWFHDWFEQFSNRSPAAPKST